MEPTKHVPVVQQEPCDAEQSIPWEVWSSQLVLFRVNVWAGSLLSQDKGRRCTERSGTALNHNLRSWALEVNGCLVARVL
jgi:hypothetical protein